MLCMEEILHHLGWLKPPKKCDKPPINWCRISSIHISSISNSMAQIKYSINNS